VTNPPPDAVLQAFGARGPATLLPGGQGKTFQAHVRAASGSSPNTIVLKRTSFAREAELTAELFERLDGPGFRVPRPVRSRAGGCVYEGWTAWGHIDGSHAGPNGGRWPETIAACRAFHAALANEPDGTWRPVLQQRTDPWSVSDRLTFGELVAAPIVPLREIIARLERLLEPVKARPQLIHGDFTANVLFADGERPCVIDFSPYWRPAEFALGVVVADAIAWAGAGREVVDLCADVPRFRAWLARGTLRRVSESDQHTRAGKANGEASGLAYLPVAEILEGMRLS
jgi:uncharacterized protein (TIGR02569 family)